MCLRLCLFIFALLLSARAAYGAVVWVVAEPENAYHQRFIHALETQPWPTATRLTIRPLTDTSETQKGDLVITLGESAAARWAESPQAVLHLFLTRAQWGASHLRGEVPGHGALFIDQPVERYVALARAALPSASTLVLPHASLDAVEMESLRRDAGRAGFALRDQLVANPQAMDRLLADSDPQHDVVLFLPDPGLSSSTMMKVIVMGAYQRRLPLVAYSEGLATAGALLAVHTTVPLLAEEAAEVITQFFATGRIRSPSYPSRFDISVNYPLAKSLNLPIPARSVLMQRMREHLKEVSDVR